MISKFLSHMSILIAAILNVSLANAGQTLEWIDLIPEQERSAYLSGYDAQINHNGPQAKQSAIGSVRQDLDGNEVTIAGFVIPLEGTESSVTEFLLVPFFGACIHVPPPPANQIIYVKFEEGAPVTQLWDVVYVTGEMTTKTLDTDLATTGYLLTAESLSEYKE